MDGINRRYYIIYFTGIELINKEDSEKLIKQTRRGKIHMYVENMGYVNEKFIHSKIEDEYKLSEPYIERVEELCEEDFKDFISEQYPPPLPNTLKKLPPKKNPYNEDLL